MPWRRTAEVGFWAVMLSSQVVINSILQWIDLRRVGPGRPFWEPLTWELTSTAMVALLIPAVVAWERRHPVRWDSWRRAVPLHLLGSAVFCLVHVAGMLPLRHLVYGAVGADYRAAPLAGRRHLGFVLEDSPSVPAVDRDGDMVDLYGYASMLLATTQAQQRQIEALQKQVDELRRTVGPRRTARR